MVVRSDRQLSGLGRALHPRVVAEQGGEPVPRSMQSGTCCNRATADDKSSFGRREILPGDKTKEFLIVSIQLRESALELVHYE